MKVLVINTGSSSIKFQLFDMDKKIAIASGLAEQIGEENGGRIKYSANNNKSVFDGFIKDHNAGLQRIVNILTDEKIGVIKDKSEIDACGHRTVHGGEAFNAPTLIDDKVIAAMEKCIPLAPLHNPPNLTGIKVAKEIFPDAPQVGVFDTAFHQTMPSHAYRYAIPEELYTKHDVRRYGFHGTSHLYVSKEAAKYLKRPLDQFNCITIHVGNGASMAAIKGGKSVDTSMGLTPLEGLVMGTRCGDLDPALPHFFATNLKMDIEKINTMLNKQSGMKGLTGINDLREIEEKYINGTCDKCKLALEIYCYRIKKYIGAYYAAVGNLEAIIFTAGVGENSDIVRKLSCQGLEQMGIKIDDQKNTPRGNGIREIQSNDSKIKILVVPTNEELEIATQTVEVLKK